MPEETARPSERERDRPSHNADREEVERLMTVLKTTMRLLGLSNREVERRLGYTPSYLSRVFTGIIELKVEHVVAIARAMGMEAAEFFELAYPRRSQPPTEAVRNIRKLLNDLQPEPESQPQPAPAISSEELDQKIRDSVRQILRDMTSGQ